MPLFFMLRNFEVCLPSLLLLFIVYFSICDWQHWKGQTYGVYCVFKKQNDSKTSDMTCTVYNNSSSEAGMAWLLGNWRFFFIDCKYSVLVLISTKLSSRFEWIIGLWILSVQRDTVLHVALSCLRMEIGTLIHASLTPFSVPNLCISTPTTCLTTILPRHLSSPSLQTSSHGWSTSTCTAPMAPCMDLSTTHCPILM